MKITKEKKNPLLNREEYWMFVEHVGKPTPTRLDLIDSVSKELKKNKDVVIVDKIMSVAGQGGSNVHVFVYSKKDDIPKEKIEKMKKRIEKKKSGEPAAVPPAKAKEEEIKPEVKKEAAEKTEGEEKREEKAEKKKEDAEKLEEKRHEKKK